MTRFEMPPTIQRELDALVNGAADYHTGPVSGLHQLRPDILPMIIWELLRIKNGYGDNSLTRVRNVFHQSRGILDPPGVFLHNLSGLRKLKNRSAIIDDTIERLSRELGVEDVAAFIARAQPPKPTKYPHRWIQLLNKEPVATMGIPGSIAAWKFVHSDKGGALHSWLRDGTLHTVDTDGATTRRSISSLPGKKQYFLSSDGNHLIIVHKNYTDKSEKIERVYFELIRLANPYWVYRTGDVGFDPMNGRSTITVTWANVVHSDVGVELHVTMHNKPLPPHVGQHFRWLVDNYGNLSAVHPSPRSPERVISRPFCGPNQLLVPLQSKRDTDPYIRRIWRGGGEDKLNMGSFWYPHILDARNGRILLGGYKTPTYARYAAMINGAGQAGWNVEWRRPSYGPYIKAGALHPSGEYAAIVSGGEDVDVVYGDGRVQPIVSHADSDRSLSPAVRDIMFAPDGRLMALVSVTGNTFKLIHIPTQDV